MVVRRREKAVWKEDVDGNHSSVTRPGQRYRLILSLSLLFFLSQMEMAGGTNDYDNFEYSGTKQWLTATNEWVSFEQIGSLVDEYITDASELLL